MSLNTILLLIGAVALSLLVSYFQYFYKVKSKGAITIGLAFLRFLGVLLLLVLLINPLIELSSFQLEKTPLAIAVDNSKSVKALKPTTAVSNLVNTIKNNEALNKKFDLNFFKFDTAFKPLDSLNFAGKQTRLDKAATGLSSLYRSKKMPVLLFSDGNATSGANYVYSFAENFSLYPLVVGDTTLVYDVAISKTNANKYTFLNNKFPIEVFVNSNSKKNNSAVISISEGSKILVQKKINFSTNKTGVSLSFLLEAKRLGLNNYTVTVKGNLEEKNLKNNTKKVAVQVIDQRVKVGVVSAINHPDLAVFKRSIESNEQRKVTVLKPNDSGLNDYDFLVLYQPSNAFLNVFKVAKSNKIPLFIVTGSKTNFNFLNKQQSSFIFDAASAVENYTASPNSAFNSFLYDEINFYGLPPLVNLFTQIKTVGKIDVFLNSKVNNIATSDPLLVFTEENNQKKTYLFGENIWKWRLDYYKNNKSFEGFDQFFSKVIQYASDTIKKKNLVVDYKNNYATSEDVELRAQFFDKSFEPDLNADIKITLVNTSTKNRVDAYFVSNTNYYTVDLNHLAPGNYNFTAVEQKSKIASSGQFVIQNFDAEAQFVTPNYNQLDQLAQQNNGAVFLMNEAEVLIDELLKNPNFKPVQKEILSKTPLISLESLLILLLLLLSAEWFIRKYNGLL